MASDIYKINYLELMAEGKPLPVDFDTLLEPIDDQGVTVLHKARQQERERVIQDPMLMANLANSHTAQERALAAAAEYPSRKERQKSYHAGILVGSAYTAAAFFVAMTVANMLL